jgi:hypothetical protein
LAIFCGGGWKLDDYMGVWLKEISAIVEELWVTPWACSGLRLLVLND